MLIGEYRHTLDPKKRLSLPVKFRKEMGKEVVMTHGLDRCIFVYTKKEWAKISEELSKLGVGQADKRGFNRFLLGGAVETPVDSMGRILVPDFLKDFAELSEKVALVGVHNRVEIWDEKRWQTYKMEVSKQADQLAERLGDLGAL
jgi:MraZ protein